MTLFAANSETSRIFSLPPGVDFAQALVDGLAARLAGASPLDWARLTIWVNTRRTARRIETLLAAHGPGLLPRVQVLGDLAHTFAIDLPPVPDALRRQLALAALVGAYQERRGIRLPSGAVFDLADSLAALLDELEGEGLTPAALSAVDPGPLARHWGDNLTFLGILGEYLASQPSPYSGAEGRRAQIVARLCANWADAPPTDPVIVAGSTGSRATTRAFMAAVARLPQGAIVLPGLDDHLPDSSREHLQADHPQAALHLTLAALGATPQSVTPWYKVAPPNPARNQLVSLALRPAPVTDQWMHAGGALTPHLAAATQALTLLETESPRQEALAIAVALRHALSQGQSAALVTPDRGLARRVSNILRRWNITADDSAGQPLHLTPPGLLLRLLATSRGPTIAPVALLDILKHPLVGGQGDTRMAHLARVRALELQCLRGGAPLVGPDDLLRWAGQDAGRQNWLVPITDALFAADPLAPVSLAHWAQNLRDCAAALSSGADAAGAIWAQDAGSAAQGVMDRLVAGGGDAAPQPATLWAALLHSHLQAGEVRGQAFLPHPGIAIWGPLEARIQTADLLILGGLTEGVWPRRLPDDHWLSRPMRLAVGLPAPETSIGLAAHDFQQALGANRVILSRPLRDGEAETLPARWVLRLTNLLQGLGDVGQNCLCAMRQRGQDLVTVAKLLDRPGDQVQPAPRPNPAPPLDARPDRLSVTAIETLITDPYAIYAKRILKLSPLDDIGRTADALEKGTVIHKVMENLLHALRDDVPAAPNADLRAVIIDTLNAAVPWPAVRAIWQAQLVGILPWFLETEAARRSVAQPLAQEVAGAMTLQLPDATFTLSAKADRIDRSPDGQLAIYDYKSGSAMHMKQAPDVAIQLPLEALIAAAGGFKDIAAAQTLLMRLIFLGNAKELDIAHDAPVAQDIAAQIVAFLTAYRDPARGYPARARHDLQQYNGDYDHLSRYGEWDESDAPTVQVVP